MSAPDLRLILRDIDNAATTALYFTDLIRERLDDQSVHDTDVKILSGVTAMLEKIERLCGDARDTE